MHNPYQCQISSPSTSLFTFSFFILIPLTSTTMMHHLLLAALAGVATARFAGDMTIRTSPDGSCYSYDVKPSDTAFPHLLCTYHFGCQSHGAGKISTFKTDCRTQGTRDDATIAVRAGDELQFCRAGFCSCMHVQYLGTVDEGSGHTASNFRFNDDHAYDCK